MNNRRKSTLMHYTKEQLAENIMCLENNLAAMKVAFENQYANCIQMLNDMNLLNDTYTAAQVNCIGQTERMDGESNER